MLEYDVHACGAPTRSRARSPAVKPACQPPRLRSPMRARQSPAHPPAQPAPTRATSPSPTRRTRARSRSSTRYKNNQHFISILNAAILPTTNASDVYAPVTTGTELGVFLKNPSGDGYIGGVQDEWLDDVDAAFERSNGNNLSSSTAI